MPVCELEGEDDSPEHSYRLICVLMHQGLSLDCGGYLVQYQSCVVGNMVQRYFCLSAGDPTSPCFCLAVPVLWVLSCLIVPQNLVRDAICWGFSGRKNVTLLTMHTNILLHHNWRKLCQQWVRHQPNTNSKE